MPTNMNTTITPMILPSSRQFTLFRFKTVSNPHAKKPMALRIATVECSPNSVVPTGIAKILPANPVIA